MLKENLLKTAILRNAEVCPESENIGYYSVFSEERQNNGWDVVVNGTAYGVSGGFYFLSASAAGISITRSTNLNNIDASKYTEVILKYKYVKVREDAPADEGKVYFKTSSSASFDETKSKTFNLISDGKWHTYSIDMGDKTSWIGYITNLKIVFSTNGAKGDEIFLESIKLQNPSYNFSDETSVESRTIVGDFFDTNLVGEELPDWSIADVGTDRTASIVSDISTTSNKVALLNNTTGTSSGPKAIKILAEPIAKGFFSCKIKVSADEGKLALMRDVFLNEEIIELKFDSDGYIKYREESSTYYDLQTKTPYNNNEWISILLEFNVDTALFDIVINGIKVSTGLPYIFRGNVTGIRIENEGITSNSIYFDEVLLVEVSEVGVCPGLGTRGQIIGEEVAFSSKEIIENINDSIIVNINDYGPVVIKLLNHPGLTPYEIRDLLEKEISRLDLGGYSKCEVSYINNKYSIKSGSYGFDSSVVVSQHEASPLASELGLLTGQSDIGRPHSGAFVFSNTFRAKSYEIQAIKGKTNEGFKLSHDPLRYTVEIGAKEADTLSRRNIISGTDKTFIDFNHPATDEGKVTEVFFHGVLPANPRIKLDGTNGQINGSLFYTGVEDVKALGIRSGDLLTINTVGYEGNGTYSITLPISGRGDVVLLEDSVYLPLGTSLEFTISNVAKIKHFRVKHDGNLKLINETIVGLEGSGLYTVTHDTYKIEVDWYTHKGDYIGIYNAVSLYGGNDDSELLDAMYWEQVGDLQGEIIEIGTTIGNGVNGIGLYGRSELLQNKAIYDIVFDQYKAVEYIEIAGRQISEQREYNLCTAVGNGLDLSVNVSGTHIHHVVKLTDATPMDIPHPNIAYNVPVLTDGEKYASNGYLGAFEQNVGEATYFYISGDGEFATTEEFPVGGTYEHKYIHEYQSDPFNILMSWNVSKLVHRLVMHFKEHPNMDGFAVEWLKDSRATFDGSSPGFEKIGIGNSAEYTQVKVDGLIIDADFVAETSAFYRHFKKTFDAYITADKLDAGGAVVVFGLNPYTILDKTFNPITTKAINIHCIHHTSTKISELELYSYTDSEASLESAIELYYAIDDNTFQKITPDLLQDGSLRFRTGFPTNRLRLVVNPTNVLQLDSIDIKASDDYVRYSDAETEKAIKVIDVNPVKGGESPPTKFLVTNRTCDTADVEINIDTTEVTNNILVKSSLNTYEDVINPEIGPKALLLQDDDFDLPVIQNVAINAKTYGLANLAAFKKYYISTEYFGESDIFSTIVDGFKWAQIYTNFPQTTAGARADIGLEFPGFAAAPLGSTSTYPDHDIHAQLHSTWNILDSFNSFIIATYDPRGAKTLAMGSEIGIVDNTGRYIVLRKLVAYARAISGRRSWANYEIYDSTLGVLDTQIGFCDNFCGTVEGTEDHTVPYTLAVTRIKEPYSDVLRFSYYDSINGNGTYQWGEDNYFEIDLTPLSLQSPVKMVIGNIWTRTGLDPVGAPDDKTHVRIHNFSFGGDSTFAVHRRRAFDPARVSGPRGEFLIDNRADVTQSPTKAVAVDLTKPYYLDIIQNYTVSGNTLWNVLNSQFSKSDTDDINEVNWGNATLADARWVLLQEQSVPETQTTGLSYLDNLRVYPEITLLSEGQLYNTEWDDLNTILTDGDNRSSVSQTDYPVVVVRLADQFEVNNYKLLGTDGQEFKTRATSVFTGWRDVTQTQSSYITDDPKYVRWEEWIDYEAETKRSKPMKWIAFRNKTFNISDGESTKQYAGTVIIQTEGDRYDDIGQTNNRVDFTEYAEWFTAEYRDLNDIAELENFELQYDGDLFGSSEVTTDMDLGNTLGTPSNVFDGIDNSFVGLKLVPIHMWRVFGNLATVSGENIVYLPGSPIGDLIIPGEPTLETYIEYETVRVDGFFLELEESSGGVPNTISFQEFIGDDPTNDAHWQTFRTESDLAEGVQTSIDETVETTVEFNSGEPFYVFLEEPIQVSGIRMLITDIEFKSAVETSTTINTFQILQSETSIPESVVSITNDENIRSGGRRSLKLTYAKDNDAAVKVTLGGALELERDILWSIQDYLTFSIKVDRPDLLSFSGSYVRLGKDSRNYYEWPLSIVESGIGTNLSEVELRFAEAPEKALGTLNLGSPDLVQRESQVDFVEGPLKFFQLQIKPNTTVTEDINIWVDNFYIKRENFNLPGLNKTLYLNNTELIYYPVPNIGLEMGFLELVVTPDWTFDHGLTYAVREAFTLFTIINEHDETFSCYYDQGFGITFSVSVGHKKVLFRGGVIESLEQYVPIKISVAWDYSGEVIDSIAHSNVRFWLNDILIGDFRGPWDPTPSKTSHLFIGSVGYKPDVSYNANEYYLGSDAIRLTPYTRSIHGGVENLLISSEPKKIKYEVTQTLKDKLYISLDGINYVSGVDPTLPFIVSSVAAGDSIPVWVKTNLPTDTTNLARTAFIRTKWRIK